MAKTNCAACEDIRSTDPNLIVNGLGTTECTSLKNDTGLSPSSGHDDCTDLENLNDCFIGNMEQEVDAYEVCDWKNFMKNFIPNLWTTTKGIICAICGLWKNIHRLECILDYMMEGKSFSFGEYSSNTSSYIVAGKGVSFANVGASGTSSDILLRYIAGGFATLSGSCLLYNANFTDRTATYNFDNEGVSPTKSTSRKGNPEWNQTNHNPNGGSQLLYELRIKKSEYPQIASMFAGFSLNSEGGGYHGQVQAFVAGRYANGQNGFCDHGTGEPGNSNSDRGHLVPDGWIYIQMRITWIESLNADSEGKQYSPYGVLGIRMNQDAIDC